MNKVTSHRKRPCGICRRWFRPDPRVKKRQKTCGDPACMREWHRRKCAEWNRQNAGIIQRERLVGKDLIAFDGHRFQVLSLPPQPVASHARLLKTLQDMSERDPATIHRDICDALGVDPDRQRMRLRK